MAGRERKSPIRVKEETEKGDVFRALEGVVDTQYLSKRFKDIYGATRLSPFDIMIVSLMEIVRQNAKIMSLSHEDVTEEALAKLPISEANELKELWQLKKRYMRNIFTSVYVTAESFEYMYGLAKQSEDGGSRIEGVELVTGSTVKFSDPGKMGTMEKWKRRLFGDVLFPV